MDRNQREREREGGRERDSELKGERNRENQAAGGRKGRRKGRRTWSTTWLLLQTQRYSLVTESSWPDSDIVRPVVPADQTLTTVPVAWTSPQPCWLKGMGHVQG